MCRDVLLLLCLFYLLFLGVYVDDSGLSVKDIKMLFFGYDDCKVVNCFEESLWDVIGQLEIVSGNLCMVMFIFLYLVLIVGYCLLMFLCGKLDKVVVLCFIFCKGNWVYEIYGIDG